MINVFCASNHERDGLIKETRSLEELHIKLSPIPPKKKKILLDFRAEDMQTDRTLKCFHYLAS